MPQEILRTFGPLSDRFNQDLHFLGPCQMAPYQLLWTQPKPTILNQCCFKPVSESDSPSYSNLISTDCVDSFDCTPEEVSVYLKQIKSYTAPGPDGITAWMLSSLAEDVAPSVASIFNLSISSGRLPADWK